ncbi:TetR/AcrR family transcriptional regulator [Parasphingorhabdus halotolerans]|uniref:TetR/AcrR family transcriptional regulator n=1 Tax=Parasphingorhabdus halotolerans TaxID=2725558 RepID=A0A6H2DQ38_9SPHN|nr:TetR/AcrR family transcriptional regulator [Parasphingorhabdus halotolerans]QJB70093.1 TetR/AcrR family transcriptional regulator [Parasphingorhabdus halotolerans]
MAKKGNSVNIKESAKETGTYHHGDLRSAALSLGMEQIENLDHPDIGLRALARDLGVSATALYRHFPNKDALLDALAMEALNRLGANQAKAAMAAGGGREGFVEVGITYVEWAVKNPAQMRLIYSRVGEVDLTIEDASQMGEAFRQLRTGIAAMMPKSMNVEERAVAALHTWSLVHGLAMLILDGQVEYDPAMIRKVVTMTDFRLKQSD